MNRTDFAYLAVILLAGLLFAVAAVAGPAEDGLFQKANEAYSKGDYEQAIAKYRQITEKAGYSPSVLFNLANSYALAGNTGKAILNYQRALRLSPSDSDISGNLELVKKENGLFPKEPSQLERFFRLLNLNQWAALIPVCLVLLTFFLAANMLYSFSRQMVTSVTSICLLLLLLASAGTLDRYRYFNPSVVISADAKLFLSPFDSSASIGALQEGRLVYPRKSHGAFSYVTDETDRKGWIPTSQIEAVCQPEKAGS